MAGTEAIALRDFVHGDITAVEGRLVRHRDGSLVSETLAVALERKGRVRIRVKTPVTIQPAVPRAEGKALDDGRGQPSSASQAAPASPTTISSASVPGAAKPRTKGVTSPS